MKCLIYSPQIESAWLNQALPGVFPLLLKLVNKPLIEYYFEFCHQLGIKDVRVVVGESHPEFQRDYNSGTPWGLNLSHNLAKPDDAIRRVLVKNSAFVTSDDLLVINGFFFINFALSSSGYKFFDTSNDLVIKQDHSELILIKKKESMAGFDPTKIPEFDDPELSITPLKSVQKYFHLCMDILQNRPDDFTLPGYNNAHGEYVGKSIVIHGSANAVKNVMIGDNVRIQNRVLYGPNTILGNNVIIDSFSTIKNSIIYDKTYIGVDLEITDKIVYKNKLIDIKSGTFMDITDKIFAAELHQHLFRSFFHRLVHNTIAVSMLLLYLPGYLLFLLLHPLAHFKQNRDEFYLNRKGRSKKLSFWIPSKKNILTSVFQIFSLHKYPLLWQVLAGNILLVGNKLLPKSTRSHKIIDELSDYQPGMFDNSSTLPAPENDDQFIINELAYDSNVSLMQDLQILFKSTFNYMG